MARSATGPAKQETFGAMLTRLRETAGPISPATGKPTSMSIRELARRSGWWEGSTIHERPRGSLTPGHLSGIEAGNNPPPREPEKIRTLARALGNVAEVDLLRAAGYGPQLQASRHWPERVAFVLAEDGWTADMVERGQDALMLIKQTEDKRRRRRERQA